MLKNLLLVLLGIALVAGFYYWQHGKLPTRAQLPQALQADDAPKTLYKWRDAQGKIHYGDQAPAQQSVIIIEAPSLDTNVIKLNKQAAE